MVRLEAEIEIANPAHPHCPTVLVLDTSSSMSGDKIRQLNEGLRSFRDDVLGDEMASKRVELAVITFGGTVRVVHDFSPMEAFDPPILTAEGSTPMGEAILCAAELVEKRKQSYREKGIDYYRPWIFMITDGEPTDMYPGDEMWNRVVQCVHEGEVQKRFAFFAVGVEPAEMAVLARIMPPSRHPIKLKHGNFKEMFQWLSRSQQKVSASRVGEQVELENPVGPQGWGEISTV